MNMAGSRNTKPVSDVLLITGFLGAGKTTLLKRILSWESDLSDTVVLVNEFGEVGIDGDLLKDAGSDVVELTSGCICCSLTVDLKQSLSRISEQYHPRRIIIEASGVADPGAIIPLLRDPSLCGVMKLEKIVTVLDADVWEAREVFGQLFYNQLEAAHLILLNKADTADETDIPRYLGELHAVLPNCQVIPTVRCGIDADTLWTPAAPKGITLRPMHTFNEISLGDWGHGHNQTHETSEAPGTTITVEHFVTFSFENPRAIDEDRFLQFIKALPWEVFRMKGSVRFADRTEIVNFVGGKAEWSPWDGACRTRLAFIGWNITPDEILEGLNACTVPQASP
jgi:G3E family GTPase